jgi:glycosyltransferase involved in cell wall biosynthesis
MRILHITPHLGGGVGKAHAALSHALPDVVEQTFILLEAPFDRRFADAINARGARVLVADNLDQVARLAGEADIVQFEFWNHPRLFECLACCPFPAMRSVFWSHVSGLHKPVVQPGLIEAAARFVYTTPASLELPSVASIRKAVPKKIAVINSGFGFAEAPPRVPMAGRKPTIAHLGTVNFLKMHPGFFDAIDRLADDDIRVSVWGRVDPSGEVAARAQAMRHPERIVFRGETAEPSAALADADIFFYPLQPDHYGTAENALVEAMSLGLVPVVLNNPAERAIVRHGETGFIANAIEECTSLLEELLHSRELRERLSQNAIRHVAQTRTPAISAQDFMILWLGLLPESPQHRDFRATVGASPADWFLATQRLPGTAWKPPRRQGPQLAAKGTLAHFESVFPATASLRRRHA